MIPTKPVVAYGVYWRMKPSEYDPDPEWRLFYGWYRDRKYADEECKLVRTNPCCGEAKVVKRVTTFEDVAEEVTA